MGLFFFGRKHTFVDISAHYLHLVLRVITIGEIRIDQKIAKKAFSFMLCYTYLSC